MAVTGIICEYNPLHLGHKKQLDFVKARDPEGSLVCLMSGNYVQRGKPAILDKSLRAQAAILSGADLVLELPITAALSSAEGFAAGGVEILGKFCDFLCFGAECGDEKQIMEAAQALLSERFRELLQPELQKGLSFPAARENALAALGISPEITGRPNNILAIEYCKAILAGNYRMAPIAILRQGDYHEEQADPKNPSATALRKLMMYSGVWLDYVPREAREAFDGALIHDLSFGERAILGKLRTMTDEEFESLPYGSEGLWRKLMKNARCLSSVEEILTATKSKRYTRTRLDRMLLCAFLGIDQGMLSSPAPYVRALAFNDKGRQLLRQAKETQVILNAGEPAEGPYWELEKRAGDLYGLFSEGGPERPGREEKRRVFYLRQENPEAFY